MALIKKQTKRELAVERLEELINQKKHLNNLVNDLFWDYDRLTSSGKLTLDKIAKLIGVPTEEEVRKTTLKSLGK